MIDDDNDDDVIESTVVAADATEECLETAAPADAAAVAVATKEYAKGPVFCVAVNVVGGGGGGWDLFRDLRVVVKSFGLGGAFKGNFAFAFCKRFTDAAEFKNVALPFDDGDGNKVGVWNSGLLLATGTEGGGGGSGAVISISFVILSFFGSLNLLSSERVWPIFETSAVFVTLLWSTLFLSWSKSDSGGVVSGCCLSSGTMLVKFSLPEDMIALYF